MTTTTHIFEKIEDKRKLKLTCKHCQKKIVRTIKEWQTISPFNKKTVDQIRRENREELDAVEKELLADGVVCNTCWDEGKK